MKDFISKTIYQKIIHTIIIVGLLFPYGFAFPQIASANFNEQINYQGKLTNSSNSAVADGLYHMKFRLYTQAVGGSHIWEDDRSAVVGNRINVTNGLFSVLLGSSTPLGSVNFNQDLWLEVEIGGTDGLSWETLSPRKQLGTVPSAFEAKRLNGLTSGQFIRSDASNSTTTASTFLSIIQNGAGKIAEFFGPSSTSVLSVTSTGRVGIGSTTPSATLSVSGNSYISGTAFFGGGITSTSTLNISGLSTLQNIMAGQATTTNLAITNITSALLKTNASGSVVPAILGTDFEAPLTFSGGLTRTANNIAPTSGYTIPLTASTTDWNIAYINRITSAVYPLQISSNSISLAFGTTTANTWSQLQIFNGGATTTQLTTTGNTYLATLGGRVGIGTTSPSTLLSVQGETMASFFTAYSTTSTTTIAGSLSVGGGALSHNFATGVTSIDNLALGNINFEADSGIVSWIDMPVTSASTIGTVNSYTAQIDGNPMFTIYSESDGAGGTQNRRIGIGTTTPWASLSVNPVAITGPAFVIGSSTQCVTGDTKLRRRRRRKGKNGEEEFEYDEPTILDIEEGDEIESLDQKTNKLVWSKVKKVAYTGRKPIFKLTTESGKTIRTTHNHPYLTKVGWRKVSDLSLGMEIGEVSKAININNEQKTKKKLGIFVDGANMYYGSKHAGWKFDLSKVKKLFESLYDIEVFNYYSAVPDESDPAHTSTIYYLQKIGKFAKLITKPLKYIEIAKGKYEKKGDLDVNLALDVMVATKNLDVVIVVSGDSDLVALRDMVLSETEKKFMFLGFKRGTAWEIKQGKYLEFEKIRPLVELGIEQKATPDLSAGRTLVESIIGDSEKLSSVDVDKMTWTKIAQIERLPEEDVYDIEIENTHNFVANGIIAHNTMFLVNNNGNVGIGTTSPYAKLSVVGETVSEYFTATTTTGTSTLPNLFATNLRLSGRLYDSANSAGTNGMVLQTTGSGTEWVATSTLGFASSATAFQQGGNAFGTTATLGTTDNQNLSIITNNTAKMTVLDNGNVGIGTTSPSEKLNVYNTNAVAMKLDTGNDAYSLTLEANFSAADSFNLKNSDGSFLQYDRIGNRNTTLGINGGLVVDMNGNVGIGTTSPSAKLSVKGGGTTTGRAFVVSDSANTERFTILDNGNVGVGTVSPQVNLHTYGTTGNVRNQIEHSSATGIAGLVFKNATQRYDIQVQGTDDQQLLFYDSTEADAMFEIKGGASGYAKLYTNNVERLRLSATGGLSLGNSTYVGTDPGAGSMIIQGNVGIGTTSPSAKLSVKGGGTTTGRAFAVSDSADAEKFTILDNGNVGIGTTTVGSRLVVQGSGATSATKNLSLLNSAGTEMVTVLNNGNVGIGTTSVSSKLTVAQSADDNGIQIRGYDDRSAEYLNLNLDLSGFSNINASKGFRLQQAGANIAFISSNSEDGFRLYDDIPMTFGIDRDYQIGYHSSSDSLRFVDGNSLSANVRMAIDNTGNVGIGTTSPSHKLDIIGAVRITDTASDATAKYMHLYGSQHSNSNGDWTVLRGSALSGLNAVEIGGGNASYDSATEIRLYTGASVNTLGGTERMRITSSGNVGIGTTGPASKLDVYSTTNPEIRISNGGGTSPSPTLTFFRQSGVSANINYDASQKNLIFQNDYSTVDTSGNLLFNTRGANTRMVITGAGNVGIGTTTPATKLQITSGAQVNPMVAGTASGHFSLTDGNAQYGLYMGVLGTGNSWIQAGRVASAEYYNLLLQANGGSVGIGTTSPWAKLSVNNYSAGASTQPLFVVASSTGTGATSTAFIIDSIGNVGIGRTNPSAKLEVDAGLAGGNTSLLLQNNESFSFKDSVGNVRRVYLLSGLNVSYIGPIDAGWGASTVVSAGTDLALRVNGASGAFTTAMSIGTSGRVGIGTTSPFAKLSIHANNGETNTTLFNIASSTGSATTSLFTVLNNGNVGIGVSNPTATLQVNGAIATNDKFILGTGASYAGRLVDGGTFISLDTYNGSNFTSRDLYLRGNTVSIHTGSTPSERITVSSDGHVVINNSNSVDTALSVKRTATFDTGSTSLTAVQIYGRSGQTANLMQVGATSANGGLFAINPAGNVGVGTTSPFAKLSIHANNGETNTTLFNIASSTGSATTSLFTVLNNGKVGVGTASPSQELTVIGTAYITGNYIVGAGGGLRDSATQNQRFNVDATTASIWTNNQNRIIVNQDGNVGIGTTTPNVGFHVNNAGDGAIEALSTAPTRGALFGNSTTNAVLALGVNGGNASWIQARTKTAGGIALDMSLNPLGGNVGVGTSSPWKKLSVSGDMSLTGALFDANASAGTNGMVLQSTGSGTQWVATSSLGISGGGTPSGSNKQIQFNNNGSFGGSELYWDSANNRLGFGTSTPTTKMYITNEGDARAHIRLAYTNEERYRSDFSMATSTGAGWNAYDDTANEYLPITIDGSKTILGKYGNIGIGITSPTAKFDIQGAASADIFRIATSTGGTVIEINSWGSFVQRLSSTTAFSIQTTAGDPVFEVDTSSTNNSGIDITASSGQTSNLLNMFSSGGTFLSGFTASGGLFMNISSTTALNIMNGSGSTAFVVNSSSQSVGIGTSTLTYALNVDGDSASSYVARINNKNTGTGADGLLISLGVANASRTTGNYFIGFSDGAGTVAGKIQGGASAVAYTTSGADLAEYFRVLDTNDVPMAGEIVMLGQAGKNAVLRADYETLGMNEPVGIVSTNPGFVGNGPVCKAGDIDCDKNYSKYNVLVALVGQVPVKVSNENGDIVVGDYLTLSSTTPGVAVKMIESGYTVGRALTLATTTEKVVGGATTTNEMVVVLVEKGWRDVGGVEIADLNGGESLEVPTVFAGLFNFLKKIGLEIGNNFVRLVNLVVEKITAQRVETEVLCLDDVCITKTELQQILNSAGQSPAIYGGTSGGDSGGGSTDDNTTSDDTSGEETVSDGTTVSETPVEEPAEEPVVEEPVEEPVVEDSVESDSTENP